MPHRKQWVHLHGLCHDGVSFATGRGRGGFSGRRGQQGHANLVEPLASSRGNAHDRAKKKSAKKSEITGESIRHSGSGQVTDSAGGTLASSSTSSLSSSQAGDGGRWLKVPAPGL